MEKENKEQEQAIVTREELDLIKECIACMMTVQMQTVLVLSKRDEIDLTNEYGDLLTQMLIASASLRDRVSPDVQKFREKQKESKDIDTELLNAVRSGLQNIAKEQR